MYSYDQKRLRQALSGTGSTYNTPVVDVVSSAGGVSCMARVISMAFSLPCMKAIRIRRPVRLSKLCQCTYLLFRVWMMPPSVISASCRYHILYHGCNNWANQISCFEVNKCDIYLQMRYIILPPDSLYLLLT